MSSSSASPPQPSPFPKAGMTREEARALLETASREWTRRHPGVPQVPTPPQWRFLNLQCREALYGGAAGGGKSSALLMAALQYVHVPRYSAIIFRRTFADLAKADALMDRSKAWLSTSGAVWNEQQKVWRWPGGGTLAFGYLEHESDVYGHQGAAYQFIGFDEATQFSEQQYRYLLSRLRRLKTMAEVPLRVRAASNPGGAGHEWVKRRFILEGPSKGRVFVPARMDDNPHLDQAEYEQSLAELDPVTRAQLRHGDWDMMPTGPLFEREWFKRVSEIPDGPGAWRWVRFWDLAATAPKPGRDPDFTAGALVGFRDGDYLLADMRRCRKPPREVESLVVDTAARDRERFGHVSTWMEQEPGSAGVKVIDDYERLLAGYEFRGLRATGSKITRCRPVASAAQNGHFYVLEDDWVSDFLDEIVPFPTKGIHDDQVDTVSGAVDRLANEPLWVV